MPASAFFTLVIISGTESFAKICDELNPDNPLGGLRAYRVLAVNLRPFSPLARMSIDWLWTSPNRQNCLATCLTILMDYLG
jgi:hypothetical protein